MKEERRVGQNRGETRLNDNAKEKGYSRGEKTAAKGKSKRKTAASKSVAKILVTRQDELLSDWMDNIKSLTGTRTLELMTEEQLRV
ncbi:hypothetical protein J7K50_02875 [bacterium]|nr:hypothetical protein [bacterium]